MSMPPAAAASGLPPPQQPQQPPPQAQAIAMGERFGQGQQGALPPGGSGGQWSSGAFQWLTDGESCWWSFWCPLLLFARTTARFDLHPNPYMLATQLLLAAALAAVLTPLLGPLISIASWVGFALWRARYRGRLRAHLGIQEGSACEDFSLHCFCSPCAVAQEAREAKGRGMPAVEFCTGEPLLPPLPSTATDLPTTTSGQQQQPPQGQQQHESLASALRGVSRCSKLILTGSGVLMLVSLLTSFLASTPGDAFVLLLALLQPFIILYLVYWRGYQKDASLDAVIKLFAVGFFWTAQFAAMAEPGVELLLMGVLAACGLLPNLDPETATEADVQAWAKGHMATVIVVLFLMSFVVAAGVEELFKYLALKFCTLAGGEPRSPRAILIYLVAAAAGFACCENIAYVFGVPSTASGGVKGAGTSMFLGELQVLALRALMPVHVICASLQAVQWIKATGEGRPGMSTFWILLPAVLLHGTFDFSLMVIAACVFAFDLDEGLWSGVSLGIGLALTLLGLFLALGLWKHQQRRLSHGGWLRVGDASTYEGAGMEFTDSPPQGRGRRQQAAQGSSSGAASAAAFPRSYQTMGDDDGPSSHAAAVV